MTGARTATPASEFPDKEPAFVWNPYLPRAEYTVLMAAGGTGKSLFTCGIAASITTGNPLPGETGNRDPGNVLFISGEDSGALFKKRLKASGANLERCFILDCEETEGLNFDAGFDEFAATVLSYNPEVVFVDPWHCFLGERADISRVNSVRPVFHKLSNLAKKADCSIVLISHVNKKAQFENANNAAIGSTDLINAARSALTLVFDEHSKQHRIVVHTKSNLGPYGQSLRYAIVDGGMKWDGTSSITRETLEQAARRRTTPQEIIAQNLNEAQLVEAIKAACSNSGPQHFTYRAFQERFGTDIFGAGQPKRALEAVQEKLFSDGYQLQTGVRVRDGGNPERGFSITPIPYGN